ncbi:hypothetical protein B566_EDAN009065 [Ephemera danica]|nr:hypothetical protein B566_EDAN009065 [Ephemera danica]
MGSTEATGTMDNDALRYILQLELPQEEILHFFWRCLTVLWCKTEVLRVVCQSRRDLLDFHLNFKHRSVTNGDGELTGFPLLCVVRSFLPYQEIECERRLRVLLELGANVNVRYRKEPTPIHVAAQCGAWQVVQLLLQYSANIDLVIKGETSRQIIERRRPELVRDVPANFIASSSPLQPLYDALYTKDETKFIQLLHKNVKDINLQTHDGRLTLLQLAIKQKLARATEELICYGADLNFMAGYCVEPILIALKNPKCECLEVLAKFKDKINLRFVYERGIFLHALEKVRSENFSNFSIILQELIKEALHQKVNPCAKNLTGDSVLALHGSGKNPVLYYLLLDNIGILALDETAIRKTPPKTMLQFFDKNIKYHEKGIDAQQGLTVCYDFLKLRDGTSGSHAAEMLPFYEMSKSREYSKTVLLHPLVKLFLTYNQ